MRTVFELMHVVAEKLAGKPVKFRFKHNKGFYGLCRLDSSGLTVIDLEPALQFNEFQLVKYFLHETAHAKLDTFIPLSLEVSDKIPVDTKTSEYHSSEQKADIQAEAWLQYAEENRDKSKDYLTGCLYSLLEL